MNKSTSFFSVIIPTRNRAALLQKCVQSVINQKFTNWELIIIDDGSTDHTHEVIHGFGDERIKYNFQEHKERSSARNRGIEVARGRYVCFIDDDDLITSDYLNDFYKYYESHNFPEVILRTGFIREMKDKSIPTINYSQKKHKNPVNYAAYHMCGVWSLSIPSRFLEEDQFPVDFPHWQDTHLILRLFMKYPFAQLSNYNYIYHIHEEMGSRHATSKYDAEERAELNVTAFDDLFSNSNLDLSSFVKEDTLSFLKAEKYIQYYLNDYHDSKKFNHSLLRKSMKQGFYIKLWKYYLLVVKYRLFK